MAKPDKPLLSLGAKGTIAGSLTFQKRGQLTIARTKPVPTDPRSPAQLAQRQIYRDAVDAWHALTPEEKEAWRGVCPGLTAYQCFMRSELKYVAPPIPIDIGPEAIDRAYFWWWDYTIIAIDNPANHTGTLKTLYVYAETDITAFSAGTFYTTGEYSRKCRASHFIGNVQAGAKRTFPDLSIEVQEGDYLGCYFSAGRIEADTAGFGGVWYAPGEYIDPGDESEYDIYPTDAISIHAIGEAAP